MALGILALVGLVSAGRLRAALALPALGLLLWVFYMAGSRGPLVALLAALALWMMTVPGNRGRVFRVLFGILLPVCGLLLVLLLPQDTSGVLAPLAGREVSNAVRLHLMSVGRAALLAAGIRGLGTGAFPTLVALGDNRYFPHNLPVEIGIENGVIGLIALFGFFIAVIRRWIRGCRVHLAEGADPRDAVLFRTAGAMLLFFFVDAQVAGDIVRNCAVWLFAGVLLAWTPERPPR